MSTIVLAAILVVNGELTLHQAAYEDARSCQRAIQELRRASTLVVHHADCTPARQLGVRGPVRRGLAAAPARPGPDCFVFDGREICGTATSPARSSRDCFVFNGREICGTAAPATPSRQCFLFNGRDVCE